MYLRGFNAPATPYVAWLSGCLLALFACDAARAVSPTIHDARAMTVHGIYGEPITLIGGIFEGEPFVAGGASRPRVVLVDSLWTSADLDGDGRDDLAVLLSESSGGSGSVLYLAVAAQRGETLENIATVAIGDRVQVRSMSASAGGITLGLVVAGAADPACCPTEKLRISYRLESGALAETDREALGELSTADLAGTEWRLTHLSREEAAPENPRITAHFENGEIAGSDGCNRYGAAFEAETPYQVLVGPIRTTRMACAPAVTEPGERFLRALSSVRQYGFLLGQLMMTYGDDGGVETLRFTAATTE